jgi:hypothetical protein
MEDTAIKALNHLQQKGQYRRHPLFPAGNRVISD